MVVGLSLCTSLFPRLPALSHALLFCSLISTFLLVVIGSEPALTSTQSHFPSFSVPAKWGPCTLPPVHPLRSGPSRLLLKVLSFNHFFKKVFFFLFFFFYPGQYKVTDHISAAFWLSDHLIKPRSILPPVFVDHLFFLGLRGEASGLTHTNPIPAKAFKVELVTCTNSQGFRAWLSVPYSHIVSLRIFLFFFLIPHPWHQPRQYLSNILSDVFEKFKMSEWSVRICHLTRVTFSVQRHFYSAW